MKNFIEVTSHNGTDKYVINTNDIVYIEQLYDDAIKSMIHLRIDIPICKYVGLTDNNCLYLSNSYDSLVEMLR